MHLKYTVRVVVLVILATAAIMANTSSQEQVKAKIITQQEYFESFVPVSNAPETFYFKAESPLLRGLDLHFQVTIKSLLEDGGIKLMSSHKVNDDLENMNFGKSALSDVVTRELQNETHMFKFRYEWHRIQKIENSAVRIEKECQLADTITLYLRDQHISAAALDQLEGKFRDTIIARFEASLLARMPPKDIKRLPLTNPIR